MENSNLDGFFSHDTSNEPETVIEETTPEVIETEVVTPEDEAPAEVSEPVEPAAKTEDGSKWVPVDALISERTKAKQSSDEAASLRQQIADLQAAQQAQTVPDPYDNPAGYHQMMQQQIQAQVAQQVAYQNLTHSRNRAVEKYGKEQMDEVADWAGQQATANPQFEAQLFAQADPAEWVIAEKKRADELSAFTANREAFIRAEAAKLGFAEISAQPVMEAQSTVARKPSGPASIVNAKSRDTVAPHKPEDAFDAIFKKS